jgi:nucleotide-binding universal stress UspA family protein
MVYVDVDGDPKNRVSLAAAVADKFNATLIGLCALAIRPLFLTEDFGTAEVTERDIEKMKAKIDRKGDWFRTFVGTDHRRIEWRSVLDFPIEALAREARSADLVVIGRTSALGDAYSSLNFKTALLRIGRPALVVPDGVSSLRADHIVVGWKDAREARRATRDALPFLGKAARVTIVELSEVGEQSIVQKHINDVARYLERHGIKGDPQVLLREGKSDAVQLTNVAREVGADLLVTGAYGHSRLGEWFFGGVTNDLLATSPICCLMSH